MKDSSEQVLLNLKKARSHIDKIIEMVEEDVCCLDIIQQLNAVIGYLKSTKNHKLSEHLQDCFSKGTKSRSFRRDKKLIGEVIKVIKISD